jgi:hypothetical protein
MDAKPPTDDERRAWLQLRHLTAERDRVAAERDQLRRQLRGALYSGPGWPGQPVPELKERLATATAAWHRLVDEIHRTVDGNRPPSTIPMAPPVLGGILQTGVPVMRVRR